MQHSCVTSQPVTDGRAPDSGGRPAILTPDQRLRVFVSSTLQELADERAAAQRAIESVHLVPVMFELGARPHPPRSLYRAYLEQSDVFVGLYWQRYGWVAPGDTISGLEDELHLSDAMPRLIYRKRPAPGIEPELRRMLDELENARGVSYKYFTDAAELESLVANDLALLLTERFHGRVEPEPGHGITPSPLPAETAPFVGRQTELQQLESLLGRDDVRLLTLTGPGGIGKSRLALRLAKRTQSQFHDGAHLVNLSNVTDERFVPDAIVSALHLRDVSPARPMEALCDDLATRELLLIIDGFEHLLDAAPVLVDLLEAAPGLKVVVTSRAALRVKGEFEFPVPSMSLPGRAATVDDLVESDAVSLFAQRAEAVRFGFAVDERNVETVAAICRRVDAVPLAIELAAARVRLLPVDALLARLGDRLDLLVGGPRDAPERHRTLRATIDWSYRLLGPDEQRLFARCAVFPDSFDLDAAEAVCRDADKSDVLEGVTSLTEKNLLQVVGGPEPRFRMLATIHDYARETLDASGELDAMAVRHAEYFRDFGVKASAGVRGSDEVIWMRRLGPHGDAENIRTAFEWFLAHERVEDVATMAWALWLPAFVRGDFVEAYTIAGRALEIDVPISSRGLVRLRTVYGIFATGIGDLTNGLPALVQALELAREHNDDEAVAYALLALALISAVVEGEERARELVRDGLERLRGLGDTWGIAMALDVLGWLEVSLEFHDEPAVFEQALDAAEAAHDQGMLAMAEENFAEHLLHEGDVEGAAAMLAAALRRFRSVNSIYATAYGIDGVARLAAIDGHPEVAARLLGASERMRTKMGAPIWPSAAARQARLVEDVRAAVPDVAGVWEEGTNLRFDDAIDAALAYLSSR